MSLGNSEEKSLLTLIIREELFVCFVSLEKDKKFLKMNEISKSTDGDKLMTAMICSINVGG